MNHSNFPNPNLKTGLIFISKPAASSFTKLCKCDFLTQSHSFYKFSKWNDLKTCKAPNQSDGIITSTNWKTTFSSFSFPHWSKLSLRVPVNRIGSWGMIDRLDLLKGKSHIIKSSLALSFETWSTYASMNLRIRESLTLPFLSLFSPIFEIFNPSMIICPLSPSMRRNRATLIRDYQTIWYH